MGDAENSELGRLKKTLKEKCPICSKNLQIRARKFIVVEFGEDIEKEKEYIRCSNLSCDYERGIDKKSQKTKKRKRERGDIEW